MIENEFQKEINPEYVPTAPKKERLKNPLVIIGLSVLIIIIIFSTVMLFNKSTTDTQSLLPTTLPETMFTPRPAEIKISSPLATDASVLKVKKEISENENTANSMDLSESNLSFPIIDFNIGF